VIAGMILNSCEFIEPKPISLPEATQTGANTFGCKVNGEIWVANGNSNYRSIASNAYNVETGGFEVFGYNTKDFEGRTSVRAGCNNCFGVGVYTDFDIYPHYFSGSIGDIDQGGGHIDTTGSSFVEITRFDLENRIISGTFEYDLYDKENGQKIKITEGRFDLSGVYVF
jgi:hypothetical protein